MVTVIFGLWLKYIASDTCFIKVYIIYVFIIGTTLNFLKVRHYYVLSYYVAFDK